MKLDTCISGRSGSITITGTITGSKFRYQREDGQVVEGEFSIQPLETGANSILIGEQVYQVRPATADEVEVNGSLIRAEVFDPRALRSQKGSAATGGRAEIASQMPGKVVRLLAAQGDSVEAGQGLLVVEAMKMQNEVTSPKTGRVAEVRTSPGAAVAAGEVLMVVE